MNVLEVQGWIMIALEASVVGILIVEYVYDRNWNEHVKRLKKRARQKFEFEYLTKGEMK